MSNFKKNLKKILIKIINYLGLYRSEEILLRKVFLELGEKHSNPLITGKLFGFSQSDEDGITLEILKRLDIQKGSFLEFGVGDGTENNTLILLALGWNGMWFGGEDLIFNPTGSKKLNFKKVWITKENIYKLYESSSLKPDLISIDLDGNDILL